MKIILLFWGWKFFGWISEAYAELHTRLYIGWTKEAKVVPVDIMVKEQVQREIIEVLTWKKYATNELQAKAVVERLSRYIRFSIRKV